MLIGNAMVEQDDHGRSAVLDRPLQPVPTVEGRGVVVRLMGQSFPEWDRRVFRHCLGPCFQSVSATPLVHYYADVSSSRPSPAFNSAFTVCPVDHAPLRSLANVLFGVTRTVEQALATARKLDL